MIVCTSAKELATFYRHFRMSAHFRVVNLVEALFTDPTQRGWKTWQWGFVLTDEA